MGGFVWTDIGHCLDCGEQQGLVRLLRGRDGRDVRPGGVDCPVARRYHCLVVDLRVCALQGLENLVLESGNETHAEDSRQFPRRVVAGEDSTDRILVPFLGRARRRFQDSPSHLLRNATVDIETVERLLDRVKRAFGNWKVIVVLETVGICLLEYRAQGDRRPAANLLGLVATLHNGDQCSGQFVVDNRVVPCKPGREKEVGLRRSIIPKDVE